MNHSRYVATCYSGDIEINLALVQSGWAFADEKATVPLYYHAQLAAEEERVGMHKYVAEKPWDFRRRTKRVKETDIAEVPCPPGQSSKRFCTAQQ